MPIFQGYGAGMSHLFGPTGGYLAGFVAGAFIVGLLMDRKRCGFLYIMLVMSLGLFVVYACGIAWLVVGYKLGFIKAVFLGFVPFIPGAVVKLIVGSWIYSRIKSRTDILIK